MWIGIIIAVAIIACMLDSEIGKIFFGAGVLAIGLLLLKWITGFGLFAFLAKACAVIMVVVVIGWVLVAIFDV